MIPSALQEYDLGKNVEAKIFGNGLINNTWLVTNNKGKYILQRINQNVFKQPSFIDENIKAIANYLSLHFPGYIFTVPVPTINNKTLVQNNEGYFRLFQFIENSKTYTVAPNPQIAFEAAKQFGKFTKLLSGFNQSTLQITLPDFHNLSLRYTQFLQSLQQANKERLKASQQNIDFLKAHKNIVDVYEQILLNNAFKKRVTHHDTKISNVLFSENDKGICVIDLDTVMPGYFISDVGDMLRTYLCEASEEETDFSKIEIRNEYFIAIVHGYLAEMKEELSADEINAFVYAGKFMIYMQALRFLTDYINNDIYYGAKYPQHNLNRATNQIVLLQHLLDKEEWLNKIVNDFVAA